MFPTVLKALVATSALTLAVVLAPAVDVAPGTPGALASGDYGGAGHASLHDSPDSANSVDNIAHRCSESRYAGYFGGRARLYGGLCPRRAGLGGHRRPPTGS